MTYLQVKNDSGGPHELSVTFATSSDTGYNNWTNMPGGAITLDTTGYWLIVYRGHGANFASGGNSGYRVLLNGGVLDTATGGSGWDAGIGLRWRGLANRNDVVQFQYFEDNQSFGGDVSGTLYATFIPTPLYRGN